MQSMNTGAIQILLHYQDESVTEERFDSFLQEVKVLADKHGISLDDYQSFLLRSTEYKIAPCKRCGHLTVNRQDVKDGIENMLPDFWFYVRRGKVGGDVAICELCDPLAHAT